MKKYASLLLFALLLNGCDDGDLTVETIDFKDITATSRDATNTLIYKLKPQEALILQMPEDKLATQPDTITYTFDNSQYRFFIERMTEQYLNQTFAMQYHQLRQILIKNGMQLADK
ncbi:hypothetical protein ACQ9BO_11910 [Flavobacterium sp. P21]|uniref:hypothetical protein n=1 Tax=Flavobacterium sp. P21 TaxID=3423948 RepID=UPI003D67E160